MTSTELDLLAWRPPVHNGTPTSRAAADAIKPSAETLRGKLLTTLRRHPEGLTDEEMQFTADMSGSTQRPRRQELQRMGLVVRTDATRETRSGRQATIWRARV